MHINSLELSNWTRSHRDTLNHRYEVIVFTSMAVFVILTVLSDPASIPWLDKPILVPSHSSDKFDESALHCWRNFKILFPGVVTLNKRSMDWEQNCCKTVFLIKGFHWWPCYRNPLLNYFAPKVSKSTSKYTLAGVISLGELQMNKETKKKKYVNLTLCLALSDTPMINK